MHIQNIQDATAYADVCDDAIKLANEFWPGPLTIILNKKDIVPGIVTANLKTVGLRSPSNTHFQSMLDCLEFPLAAPSANPSTEPVPLAQQVINLFGSASPPILDGGATDLGIESTIVNLTSSIPCVVRPGHISATAIEECLGIEVKSSEKYHDIDSSNQISPGSAKLLRPQDPTHLHLSLLKCINYDHFTQTELIIVPSAIAKEQFNSFPCKIECFSKNGELKEIAKSFYGKLHEADLANFSKIHLCLLNEKDELAIAINDRISRHVAKNLSVKKIPKFLLVLKA